jgi:hypothetical protein
MRGIIVFGGYGVFGSHVARELAGRGLAVTISGRDQARAEALARTLGATCRAQVASLTDADSCFRALAGHAVAVNCAGPFQTLDPTLLELCLKADCHYVDITDDRGYARLVRSQDARFRERGLAAVYGCSSLPGISGALALVAREGAKEAVERGRVTLFIGNNNPKGSAAVGSLLAGLGRPIAAPQGQLRGFRDREVVQLPLPFGRRGVFNFDSPDYDLLPELLGAPRFAVKVGFELRLATYLFALLALLGSGYGRLTATLLELPGRAFRWLGCSGGAVMAELFCVDGTVRRAALSGHRDAQRMAALPCALVARHLAETHALKPGAATAYEFLGARPLLNALVEAGFELTVEV